MVSERNNIFSGVDLFCGAGGMSLGAELAGINIKIAIENDKSAAATFAFNHPNSEIITEDIRTLSPKEVISFRPFILFGGPPCQGFSASNTKTRDLNNPNNSLFEQFLKFVEELLPTWVVFENVAGFVSFQKGDFVRELEQRLNSFGYKTTKKTLIASDYGVPQNRNRFFLIGNRQNIDFTFPQPSFKKVTVEDAIYDLPSLKNGDNYYELPYKKSIQNEYVALMRKYSQVARQNIVSKNQDYIIERYKYIKPGQNWEAIPNHLMTNYAKIENTHSGLYKRLDPMQPAMVISNYRKNMVIHPYEHRGLSVREAARLQSFPDQFIFKGQLMDIQQQIGNAVPPLLAKAIFTQIQYYSNEFKE